MDQFITLRDAAKIWGVSNKRIRDALPDIKHVVVGGKEMVPRERPDIFTVSDPPPDPDDERRDTLGRRIGKRIPTGNKKYPFTCPSGWVAGKVEKKCLYCGGPFLPTQNWSRCCSRECGNNLFKKTGGRKGKSNFCACCGKVKHISEFEPTRRSYCLDCSKLYGAH